MSIQVTSTTESKEAVTAATGVLAEVKKDETVVEGNEAQSASAEKVDEKTEDSDTSENEENETDVEDEGDEQVEQKPKKKGGFKKRIDKLNSKLSAAEQEKEYWRQEALKHQKPASEKQSVVEKTEAVTDGKPKMDDFETHESYVEALADWKVDQKLSARDAKQKETAVKSEYQKQVDAHVTRVEAFSEKHNDFEDLMAGVDDIPMSVTVQEVILSSENGPELMYELAKNKEEYARICKLPAIAAARELGKFEAKFAKSSASTNETKEIKTTNASKPINPVNAKSTGSGKKSLSDPSLTQREYEMLRKEQIAKNASM